MLLSGILFPTELHVILTQHQKPQDLVAIAVPKRSMEANIPLFEINGRLDCAPSLEFDSSKVTTSSKRTIHGRRLAARPYRHSLNPNPFHLIQGYFVAGSVV
jgi:hypothetical protein